MRNVLIAIGILALIIGVGCAVYSYKENQLVKENTLRVESEIRFKQLVIENKHLNSNYDKKVQEIELKQALIDYLEKNPTIIIQNNDKAHLDLDKLNAYNSILLFTRNVSKYENSRERYSLHRFIKIN